MLQSGIELGVEGGRGVGGDLTLVVGWITAKLNAEEWLIYFFLSLDVLSMEDNLEFITYVYWMVLRQTSLEIAFCCAIKLGPNKTPLLLSLTFKKDEVPSALGLSPNQRKSSPRLGDSFTLFGNIFWWKNFKYYALSQSSPVFMPWQLRTARPDLMGVSQAHNRANAEWCVDV